MKSKTKVRLIYMLLFLALLATEVLIALFVHDDFVRPYLGDVLVVPVIFFLLRAAFPERIKLLPLYIFLFAAAVEVGQYFNIVKLLWLDGIRFFRILLGSTFSFLDIACYFAGAVLCFFADIAGRRLRSA